ncbi:MAG: hypothetical protein V4547_16225 [Bacteroidota bacterium]
MKSKISLKIFVCCKVSQVVTKKEKEHRRRRKKAACVLSQYIPPLCNYALRAIAQPAAVALIRYGKFGSRSSPRVLTYSLSVGAGQKCPPFFVFFSIMAGAYTV